MNRFRLLTTKLSLSIHLSSLIDILRKWIIPDTGLCFILIAVPNPLVYNVGLAFLDQQNAVIATINFFCQKKLWLKIRTTAPVSMVLNFKIISILAVLLVVLKDKINL